jgi:hypothetical protein
LSFINTENQSRSYFDFSTETGGPSGVYLPTVKIRSDGVPAYSFHFTVSAGQTYIIDPKVAVAYDFSIGSGDPDIKSVTLPLIAGTTSYTIVLPDGQKVSVAPDQTFDFTTIAAYAKGVSGFEVLGINPASNVNPYDALAFNAGLRFVSSGQFTGSMVPIAANVPEVSSWALVLVGFTGLGWLGSRRVKAASDQTEVVA